MRQPNRAEILGVLRAVVRKAGPIDLTADEIQAAMTGEVMIHEPAPADLRRTYRVVWMPDQDIYYGPGDAFGVPICHCGEPESEHGADHDFRPVGRPGL